MKSNPQTAHLLVDTPPSEPTSNNPIKPSPGAIILQWLTYAFWGWTIFALAWLTFIVCINLVDKSEYVTGSLPFAIASVLVLLPISVVCDILFARKETKVKSGFSMAIMVIHAVLFALFGIGALIGMVIALVQLSIGDSEPNSLVAVAVSLGIIALFYALVLLRTLNPFNFRWWPRAHIIIMAVTVLVLIIMAFVGPFAQARLTKDDRRIEAGLSAVKDTIDIYTTEHKSQPKSLSEVPFTGDAKSLIDDNLIEYKPEGEEPSTVVLPTLDATSPTVFENDTAQQYRYQLCVTYRARGYNSPANSTTSQEYSSYVSTYVHPAGYVCYKLVTTSLYQ